jgi:hypothetical protein
VDTFPTDTTDLPEATRPELLVLGPGDELQLRPAAVAKRLGDTTVRGCSATTARSPVPR